MNIAKAGTIAATIAASFMLASATASANTPVAVVDGTADTTLLFDTHCHVPVTVTVHNGYRPTAWRTTNLCASGSWHRFGPGVPGIWTTFFIDQGETRLSFEPGGKASGNYLLTVQIPGRSTWVRWLHAYYSPPQRDWEGTDDFVNYCIDQTKPIYSLNLRLYCWDSRVAGHYTVIDDTQDY